MIHEAAASSSFRQRDTLTAKRIFALFGCLGLLLLLWLLSTPVHQIYWATQARLFEAKTAVLAPASSGDQQYLLQMGLIRFCKTCQQHITAFQFRLSTAMHDRRHL